MSNVGNRIYWYRNIGTRTAPTFGPRQQVICDGYEETPERTAATAKALGSGTKQWKTLPPDAESSPFWWRARAGFGDLNGDGLMDLVTADAGTQREDQRLRRWHQSFRAISRCRGPAEAAPRPRHQRPRLGER